MSQEYESQGLEPLFDQYLNELAEAKRINACNALRKLWEELLAQQGTKENFAALLGLVDTLESIGVPRSVLGKQLVAQQFTPQDLVVLGESVNYRVSLAGPCRQNFVLEAVGYPLGKSGIVCSFQNPEGLIPEGLIHVYLGPVNSGITQSAEQRGNRISKPVDLGTKQIVILTKLFSRN